MIKLFQIDNNQVVRKISLNKPQYSLGRTSQNEIVFDNSKVSRKHASLVKADNTYEIRDNNSTNHIYVNGQKVEQQKLSTGDIIGISRQVSLLFVNGLEAESNRKNFIKAQNGITKDEVQIIKNITNKIISLHDLDEILQTILKEVMEVVRAEKGFIALTNQDNELEAESSVGHDIDLRQDPEHSSFSTTIVNQVMEERQPQIISDVMEKVDNSESVLSLGLRSIMCAPLLFNDQLIGVLYVDSGEKIENFTETEQYLFNILADYAAIAIKNSFSFNQIKELNSKLKQKVKKSEQRYSYFLSILPISVIVYQDHKIQYLNPAAKNLLGCSSDNGVIGSSIHDFLDPEFEKQLLEQIKENDQSFQTLPVDEARFTKVDGESISVAVGGRHFDYNGKNSIILIVKDITQRKKMEEELLKSQKLESISLLAGGIAHDFNNILTSIMGNISLVKENLPEDLNLKSLLQNAEDSCGNAVGLTEQLLTFAKGGEPVKEKFHLKNFLKDTVKFVLRGSNLDCEFSFDENLWDLNADKGQINQVINNLIINAKHAMPEGGSIQISVQNTKIKKYSEPQLQPGDYVKITIKDNGVGIAEEHLQKIFDPYFTTKQEGSGLGLATSYSVIRKHGGLIAVDSKLGQGTKFDIYLPALKNCKCPQQKEKGKIIKGEGHILFMDDEKMIRQVAKRMFEKLGYQVTLTNNGEKTLELYQKHLDSGDPFSAVVLDLTIQNGMGGKKTVKELHAIDENVKAIVTSGYSGNDAIQNYQNYGFVARVIKPYTIKKISSVLNKVVNNN